MKGTFHDYKIALWDFDAATCEAIAVSQTSVDRYVRPTIGYCSYVFTRMCSHAIMAVSAIPKTRWSRKEFEHWDFSAIAGHARAILEGYVLVMYLADASLDDDTQRAYIQTMNMYDCKKRLQFFRHRLSADEINHYENEETSIKEKLASTILFQRLETKLQNEILAGKKLMIRSPSEIITHAGIDQTDYDFFWNYFSQYIHIFSISFFRIERNSRNTGVKNNFDVAALTSSLIFSTSVLVSATDRMEELFPDVATVRNGINSNFFSGPTKNRPKHRKNPRG